MNLMIVFRVMTAFFACCAILNYASAADSKWYPIEDWGGEYPPGMTMTKDVTLTARGRPLPWSNRNVTCDLKQGATYHPWNRLRIKRDGLRFVTLNEVVPYEVRKDSWHSVWTWPDKIEQKLHLSMGDRWDALHYLGEQQHVFRMNDKLYVGDEEIFNNAESIDAHHNDATKSSPGSMRWLGLPCRNGRYGWIWMDQQILQQRSDGSTGFKPPVMSDYGLAFDELPADPVTAWTHNGSIVSLQNRGTARRFSYSQPRQGMVEEGVVEGTVLFDGSAKGLSYEGFAFIFRQGCPPEPYWAAGPVAANFRRVVLRGKAPKLDDNCRITSTVDDVLVFDLVEDNAREQDGEVPFAAYPAVGQYKGRPGKPDFRGRDRAYREYRTRLGAELAKQPRANFGGKYNLIPVFVTGGAILHVMDSASGRILWQGVLNDQNHYSLAFRPDSRLVVIQEFNSERCYRHAFAWTGKTMTEVQGPLDKPHNDEGCIEALENEYR